MDRPPPFANRPRRKGARGEGLRYEEQVLTDYLPRLLGEELIPGPWILFANRKQGSRWCQPDALWIDALKGRITIVEIKASHCPAAWWQLKQLYLPVVKKLFGAQYWDYRLVELVKWYDPSTQFPEKHKLRPKLDQAAHDEIAVHIWSPKREKYRKKGRKNA